MLTRFLVYEFGAGAGVHLVPVPGYTCTERRLVHEGTSVSRWETWLIWPGSGGAVCAVRAGMG